MDWTQTTSKLQDHPNSQLTRSHIHKCSKPFSHTTVRILHIYTSSWGACNIYITIGLSNANCIQAKGVKATHCNRNRTSHTKLQGMFCLIRATVFMSEINGCLSSELISQDGKKNLHHMSGYRPAAISSMSQTFHTQKVLSQQTHPEVKSEQWKKKSARAVGLQHAHTDTYSNPRGLK